MAGMINQLLDLLNEQAERYGELLGLSQEKKDVIIKNDIEALTKITNLENILISQSQKLEKKRMSLQTDIAAVLGIKESDLTLGALIEQMKGQEEEAALRDVGDRIRKTITQLSEINSLNASLIDNAMDYIGYSLNLLYSAANGNPAFYTAKGEPVSGGPNMFDVKH